MGENYEPKVYREDGGDKMVIANGGSLQIATGGKIAMSNDDINPGDKVIKVAKIALGAADTGGGVLSWQNPEGKAIIIQRVLLDVTTVATGACTIDVGTTATNATTTSDNLIDGKDIHAATGVWDNLNDTDNGTNGRLLQKLAAGKWVTGSRAGGTAAGTVGFAYISYITI